MCLLLDYAFAVVLGTDLSIIDAKKWNLICGGLRIEKTEVTHDDSLGYYIIFEFISEGGARVVSRLSLLSLLDLDQSKCVELSEGT